MAPQPEGFRGQLFDYQRRSLQRMIDIERGIELTVQIGSISHKFRPRGGRASTLETGVIFFTCSYDSMSRRRR